jgi:signal transduction histidine kinase
MPETRASRGHQRSIKRQLLWLVNASWLVLILVLALVGGSYGWQALHTYEVGSVVRQISLPAVNALQSLQEERELSLEASSMPTASRSDLAAQRDETDQALTAMNKVAAEQIDSAPPKIKQPMMRLTAFSNKLPEIRRQLDTNAISTADVSAYYDGPFDAASELFETQAEMLPQSDTLLGALSASALFRVYDTMSRESAVVSTALTTGELTPATLPEFAALDGAYHHELQTYQNHFAPQVKEQYQQLISSPAWQQLSTAENQVLLRGPFKHGDPLPVSVEQWKTVEDQVNSQLQEMVRKQFDLAFEKAVQDGIGDLITVGLAGFGALVVTGGFFFFSRWWSRRIVDETLVTRLRALRDESYHMATQLPLLVERLHSGASVDVDSVAASSQVYGDDEVGQVALASRQFLSQAIQATAGEAGARRGARAVFIGMARRQQALMKPLHKIVTQGQQNEVDPRQLKRWFEADNLATRARRNTDNLLVLAGQRPGRRWTDPVHLYEVIAGAVGEIERYLRVDITHIPDNLALAGPAVRDTSHLLAELIDNATNFSNENTRVRVWAEYAEYGALVEIEDAGIGMSLGTRAWANESMTNPPEFDQLVRDSDTVEQLGLFTAAHLARAHQIRVEFKLSTAGGTRASVLLPDTILVREEESSAVPRATIWGELQHTVDHAVTGTLPAATASMPAEQGAPTATPQRDKQRGEQAAPVGHHDDVQPESTANNPAINPLSQHKPSLGPKRVPGTHLPDDLPQDPSATNIVGDPTRIVGFRSAYNQE